MLARLLLLRPRAALPHAFPHLRAGLATLLGGHRPVAIGVEPVEALERALAHLLERDIALLAEHALAETTHAAVAAMVAHREAMVATTVSALGGGAAPGTGGLASLTHLRVCLGHFLAGDAAVMVEVEPIEPALLHPLAQRGARLTHFLGRDAAVAIGIEPLESLRHPFDDLGAGDIGIALAALAGSLLRGGGAPERDERGAGEKDESLGHGVNSSWTLQC